MKKIFHHLFSLTLLTTTISVQAADGIQFSDIYKNGGKIPPNSPVLVPQISPNDQVLGGELFNPTLAEFKESKASNNNSPSGLLVGDEKAPNRVSRLQSDLSTQIQQQYFFKHAQHSKVESVIADDMRITTGGKGDIWISTRIDKIYPAQWNSSQKKSKHQCADIAMRMTHDQVPLKTEDGIKYVTFWQDFKQKVCHSKDDD